ncbi:MAG: DUF4390 domain-containing protein [Nitrospinales bacterium]
MIKNNTILKKLSLVIIIFCLMSVGAQADPTMVNIGVQATEELLVIDGELVDAFSENMDEAIDSGVPMTLNYYVELRKKVVVFRDSIIGKNTIHSTVKFDSLKNIYKCSLSGKGVKRKVQTQSKNKCQQLIVTLKDIPLAPLFKLEPNEKYYVRIKAEMEADELMFPFNYLLFFVPFDGFETSWSESSLLAIESGLPLSLEASRGGQNNKKKDQRTRQDVIRSFNQ